MDINDKTLKDMPKDFQYRIAVHEVGHLLVLCSDLVVPNLSLPETITLNGESPTWGFVRGGNIISYSLLQDNYIHLIIDGSEFKQCAQKEIYFCLGGLVAEYLNKWDEWDLEIFEDGTLDFWFMEDEEIEAPELSQNMTDLEKCLLLCIKIFDCKTPESVLLKLNQDAEFLHDWFSNQKVKSMLEETTKLLLDKWEIKDDELAELSFSIMERLR